jgi:hypothetical protein
VNVVLCVSAGLEPAAALVAVTVTVVVPTGVPGITGGGVLPPPPHAAVPSSNATTNSAPAKFHRRRRIGAAKMNSAAEKISARIAPLVAVQSLKVLSPPKPTPLAAVVVTVSIVVPLPVTVTGKKAHAPFAGNPAQENVVTPLNPFEPATVTVVMAESPGLVTVIGEGAAETLKSAPGATFSSRNILDDA